MSASAVPLRPVTLLIAALGGEGGGVLTNWIVNAAQASGFPVQATSIPGVAQRTGSTTYYVEVWPRPWAELNGRAPLLALSPAIGEVDILAVTELLEAGRAIRNGFVTADRTLVIASPQRVYTTTEKIAMTDGRFDPTTLRGAIKANAQVPLLLDLQRIAQEAEAPVNAVLLGAVAGCGRLPIPVEAFRAGIRAEGKAAESNLRGFNAGLAAATDQKQGRSDADHKRADPFVDSAVLIQRMIATFPTSAHDVLSHGIRRLIDYQDAAYATLFLDRLERFRQGDETLLSTVGRHLAVRMSYEDAIRVAQAKTRPERMARIRAETGAAPEDTVVITEFLKPGLEEICDILPRSVAAIVLGMWRRSPRMQRWRKGIYIKSTSVFGHLQLHLLARWRRGRRMTWRYAHEQQAIETWLSFVQQAALLDAGLAVEVAECARLLKGYGDTYKRGQKNFQTIITQLVDPALMPGRDASVDKARVAQAVAAALADPEGAALTKVIAAAAPTTRRPMAAASD